MATDHSARHTEAQQKALGAFFRERRKSLSLTQMQLGDRTGWAQERISLLENGKYGMPSLPALVLLATAVETTLSDLLAAAGYVDEKISCTCESETAGMASLHALQHLLASPATSMTAALDPVLCREPDLPGLGTFVRTRRQALGLTQTQLGERVGWKQERVSVVETARYGLPSMPVLAQLARALEVPLLDLVAATGFRETGNVSTPN